MTETTGTLSDLIELLKRRAPATLDLLTARSDAEFESAFDALLERAVIHLEQNSRNLETLDEAGLSAVFAGTLSMPGLTVTQETNSNGHVDLTIDAHYCLPSRRKLGESKIYDGPAYHLRGLEQLIGRYATGREGRGLLLVFCRLRNISQLILKVRETMDEERPCRQKGETSSHRIRWSFLSSHEHRSGEIVEVGHIGLNMCVT